MSNYDKYIKSFEESFGVGPEDVKELTYQAVDQWDSVGHMELIATLEEAFDIMMDTDDIIDLSSFEKGKEILSENYGIEF